MEECLGVGVRRGSKSGAQEVKRQEVQERMHCCCHYLISCEGFIKLL